MFYGFSRKEIRFWKRKVRAEAKRERREDLEKIFHAGEKRGEKIGEVIGELIGERKSEKKFLMDVARRCLSLKVPLDEIAEITGLKEETISALGV